MVSGVLPDGNAARVNTEGRGGPEKQSRAHDREMRLAWGIGRLWGKGEARPPRAAGYNHRRPTIDFSLFSLEFTCGG